MTIISILLSERDRISFTWLCFLSPVHTLPHVSSFEEHQEQWFHEYSASHIHFASWFSVGLATSYTLPTTSMMTAQSVAQVSLAFKSTNLPELDFVCVFGLFIANAPPWPAQLHAQKPHGLHLDLNFVLPHRAHFSILPSSIHIVIIPSCHHFFIFYFYFFYYPVTIPGLLRFSPSETYVRPMSLFLLSPQKWTRAIRRIFPPFGAHAFYMIKIWNSVIYTISARPLYTCSSHFCYFL